MKKIIVVFVVLVAFSSWASAVDTIYPDTNAEALAMGNSIIAKNSLSAGLFTPATLTEIFLVGADVSYQKWSDNSLMALTAYTPFGVYGLSWLLIDNGNLSYLPLFLGLGGKLQLSNTDRSWIFSLGGSFGVYWLDLQTCEPNYGGSLGASYLRELNDSFAFSVAGAYDFFKWLGTGGVGMSIKDELLWLTASPNTNQETKIGAELNFKLENDSRLSLRAGLAFPEVAPSLGLGLKIKWFKLGYAYSWPLQTSTYGHLISLGFETKLWQ